MRVSAKRLGVWLAAWCAVLLVTVSAVHAQTGSRYAFDLLIGVWQADMAKSRYYPGPPPASETRTFARDAEGIKGTVLRRLADGRQELIEYRADFDHEYPVSGTEAYDAVRFKRIDTRTAEAVLSHAGRVFGIATRVISNDGQTMTITFRQEDPSLVKNVVVYRKMKP
jgi:hypothetical protein